VIISSVLVFGIRAHSQTCAFPVAISVPCSGPNNCNQSVSVLRAYWGSVKWELSQTFVWCCSAQIPDYSVGDSCGYGPVGQSVLKDRDVLEFALTHTLWTADCSGHFRPFARSWEVPTKLIDLKPKIAPSEIGG